MELLSMPTDAQRARHGGAAHEAEAASACGPEPALPVGAVGGGASGWGVSEVDF